MNFLFKAGAAAIKLFGRFFKGVPPAQAAGIFGSGLTLGGVWDSISGWFSNTANTGQVNPDDEQGVWGTLTEAWEKAGQAVQVAGFLFVTLVLVLGWKSFKKVLK